jgi:hypothetical protein
MRASLCWFGLVAALILIGCSLDKGIPAYERPVPINSDRGTLVLTLRLGCLITQTLVPGIDMVIASCTIAGTGPDPATDYFSVNTSGGLELSDLTPGTWVITVDASNAGGTLIGQGDASVEIVAGQTTNAQINIVPVSGTGTLSLTVHWDKKLHTSVTIDCSLIHMSTGQNLSPKFDFSASGNQATYTSDPPIPTGYYLLTLQVYDNKVKFWGIAEAVRIVAGQSTPGTWRID